MHSVTFAGFLIPNLFLYESLWFALLPEYTYCSKQAEVNLFHDNMLRRYRCSQIRESDKKL